MKKPPSWAARRRAHRTAAAGRAAGAQAPSAQARARGTPRFCYRASRLRGHSGCGLDYDAGMPREIAEKQALTEIHEAEEAGRIDISAAL